ncbi:MAG: hypothetical protein KJ737_01920 [Proteobacteria bacterium]|nr:hypothetical protein [Pseudomonadota bacterium]
MGKIKLIVKILIISTLMGTNAFADNYADTFGASPMGIALGNAMTARVNDWSSVYYNISGLGKTVADQDIVSDGNKEFKNQLAVSYIYNKPEFDIDIDRETAALNDLETGTIILGGAIDMNLFYKMPSYISSSRIGVVLALNDDLTMVKINDIDLRSHNFFRYGRESQTIMIMFGAGFGLFNDMLGFGLGISQSMGGSGNIVATDLIISSDPQTPDLQAKFDMEISKNPVMFGAYIRPGYMFPLLQGLDVGFSYRQESYLYIEKFNMFTVIDVGNIEMEIVAGMFDFYQPPTFTTGFSYATGNLILSLDLEVRQWSEYKVSKYMKERYANNLPELDDVIIPKLGVQLKINEAMDLLMGYYFEKSCVPDSSSEGIFNLLDNDKHVGSFGIKYRMPKLSFLSGMKGPVDLTASFQYQKLVERDIDKTAPTAANPDYTYGGECYTFMAGFVYNL